VYITRYASSLDTHHSGCTQDGNTYGQLSFASGSVLFKNTDSY